MATPPIDLDDFKTFLRWPVGDTSRDAELTDVLSSAADLVEAVVGPMAAADVTDTIREVACDGSFMLKTWPVLEVTSVTDHFSATVLDLATLDIDAPTGVVRGASWSRGYDVTASVGRNPVPEPLKEAVRVVGEQLWQSRRGPDGLNRFVNGGVPDAGQAPVYRGFAFPNRAVQLCEPYRLLWVG